MKRNILSTIFEIVFPITMFILIIGLRQVFKRETDHFEDKEYDTPTYMQNRSIFSSLSYLKVDKAKALLNDITNIQKYSQLEFINQSAYSKLNFTDLDKIDLVELIADDKIEYFRKFMADHINKSEEFKSKYLDLDYKTSPFLICSEKNEEKLKRPIIAEIGEELPPKLKKKMIIDSIVYNNLGNLSFELNFSSFKTYPLKEMEKYIKSSNYEDKKDQLICFGVRLNHYIENNTYDYSLHFFDFEKIGRGNNPDIPSNKIGMFDKLQTGPDIISIELYKQGGYNYMMKIINEYILKKETNNDYATLDYSVFPMKYWDERNDDFGQFYGYVMVIIILMAYMIPLSLYIYKMVGEKESKIKEGMKIMGLGETEYLLSYFIQYIIIAFFVSLVNAFLFKFVLTKIQYYFLFALIFLFSLDIFALIYFFQSFIDKTRISIVLSLIIYFIMYCLALGCMFENSAFGLKLVLAVFPAVNLNLGVNLLNKFEFHFRKFYNRDFTKDHFNYTLLICYCMFIVDFFVFFFLGYYLNNVLPHDFGIRRPWYFLCSLDFWNPSRKKKYLSIKDKLEFEEYNTRESNALEEEKAEYQRQSVLLKKRKDIYGRSSKFESEDIYDEKSENEVFEIRNIVKIFGDGKKAVDGVNLNFYKDEIFALLGHNGAGKTTLISMLTGMYEATRGKAIYEGNNILDSNSIDIFRKKLGICPQHDTLFEDLTIREHLEMFSIFKGVPSENVNEEVKKVLHDFQIADIQNMLARNLSAGQRRKLSIAISLIGGSEVIFLDEPSSGMDITSRRNLWEILKRQTDGKIIILTTHYMEEASVLGKRIGIINAGRMKCVGSPLFLIEKYGRFMSLNITKDIGADNDEIVDFMKTLSQNLEYEILSEEIMFRIPVKDENNEEKKLKKCLDIQNFFTNFDENINNLKIKSYSVSMPTLEDVFLNVAAEDNKKINKEEESGLLMQNQADDKVLFSLDLIDKNEQNSKFQRDFKICLKRRYLITKRDIKGIIMEIVGPILLILFGLLISKLQLTLKSKPYLIEDLEITGNQYIIFASKDNSSSLREYFDKNNNYSVEVKLTDLSNITYNSKNDSKLAIDFIDSIFIVSKDTEDRKNRSVDMSKSNYYGYYGGLLMLSENNENYELLIAVNPRVKHGLPIYSHFFLSSIIKNEYNKRHSNDPKPKNLTIQYTHHPLPLTKKLKEQNDIINNVAIIFFISISFGIMPANFISLLVKERINNSKHLMRISGINIISYWCVNYIFEYVKYYITGGICIFCLYIFDYYKDYLYIMYLIYGPAMISFTYFLSFFFKDESNAQNTIILLNFVFGGLGSITTLLFRLMDSTRTMGKIVGGFLSSIPAFCFDFTFNLLVNKEKLFSYEYSKEEYYNLADDNILVKYQYLLSLIIFCSSEIFIYTLLFVWAEKNTYSFKKPTNNILISKITDEEVKKEIKAANSIEEPFLPNDLNSNENDDLITSQSSKKKNLAVKVTNLRKVYGNGCLSKEKNVAIENLNFCIESGECFGLLGLNGAGKTTTFKCITQEVSQDNGEITVFGKDIRGNFDKLKEIFGYCPQFDAIFEHLTVYENLEFYATIKGIKTELIHTLTTNMITEMSLTEFTNKIAGRLSGGNKRKLSVAISMLGNPPIILLDEPSTGMDPEARRFMWSVIHKMSTKGRKSSVIMTTHSMDEAETLCKRMGIMVNGEFVCLGTANQIKDKYGYGYEADVRIKPMSQEKQRELMDQYRIGWDTKVSNDNLREILSILGKDNYFDELKEGRFGERLKKAINLNGEINIGVLLNWIFFVENALKFIIKGKEYFSQIVLSEHIENNFLFKLKKGKEQKSIGFFFGLFEEAKDECHITEYSIQQTSLEQIFNKFAANQGKAQKDLENINIDDEKKGIIIDDNLVNSLTN